MSSSAYHISFSFVIIIIDRTSHPVSEKDPWHWTAARDWERFRQWKGARCSVLLFFFLVALMNIIGPLTRTSSDRIEILSWQSFLPSISRSAIHRPGLDSTSSTSLMSSSSSTSQQPFFNDPCLATASNLVFYINPQRRPDIVWIGPTTWKIRIRLIATCVIVKHQLMSLSSLTVNEEGDFLILRSK